MVMGHAKIQSKSTNLTGEVVELEPSTSSTLSVESYLNEFRVEMCPHFRRHQCSNHRPFRCFNWHFANQRRRKPVRLPNGKYNYSADEYCKDFDESSGICPNGDECPLVHRVSGDTERRFHPDYYKTAMCLYPTDSHGLCPKYGNHCPFAHGENELRMMGERDEYPTEFLRPIDHLNKYRFVIEEMRWRDPIIVMREYKTRECHKPSRLCRQGYACPYFHGPRDRRRDPSKFKYRSTGCPAARDLDEWLEADVCEEGDACGFCHTRTEQQFHPEVYKSTKCNDLLEYGFCPRGIFCAFAHHDREVNERTLSASGSRHGSDSNYGSTSFLSQTSDVPPQDVNEYPRTPRRYSLTHNGLQQLSIDSGDAPPVNRVRTNSLPISYQRPITIQTASFGRDRSDSVDSTSLTHFMENFFPSPELRVAERDLFETFNMSIEMPTVPEMAPSSPSTSPRAVTTDNEMNLSSSDWEGMAGTSPPGGDIFAWSEGLRSAREACEVWKAEAEECRRRTAQAEADRDRALAERDQLLKQVNTLREHFAAMSGLAGISNKANDGAPVPDLKMMFASSPTPISSSSMLSPISLASPPSQQTTSRPTNASRAASMPSSTANNQPAKGSPFSFGAA